MLTLQRTVSFDQTSLMQVKNQRFCFLSLFIIIIISSSGSSSSGGGSGSGRSSSSSGSGSSCSSSSSRRSSFILTIYYYYLFLQNFYSDAEHIQEVRKSIMKDHCLTHQFDQNPSAKGESFAYIFVDDKFQLIYCTIAKVASTKMKTIFAKLYNKTWRGQDVSIT